MGTDAFNGPKILAAKGAEDTSFADSDQTTTMIRTAKGKTILIEHDVMTPRPYNRMYQITGTNGYADKYPTECMAFGQPTNEITAVDDLSAGNLCLKERNLIPLWPDILILSSTRIWSV